MKYHYTGTLTVRELAMGFIDAEGMSQVSITKDGDLILIFYNMPENEFRNKLLELEANPPTTIPVDPDWQGFTIAVSKSAQCRAWREQLCEYSQVLHSDLMESARSSEKEIFYDLLQEAVEVVPLPIEIYELAQQYNIPLPMPE